MKKGFTIIELLVASLLLAMLVTILTMMFNQSSIAWRTGTAGIVNLNKTRMNLGASADIRDDVLPGLGDKNAKGGSGDSRSIAYRTVSLWDTSDANDLRKKNRAYEEINWDGAPSFTIEQAKSADSYSVSDKEDGQSVSLFSVGVRSLGPDGKPDTEDDINTWPEEID